MQDYGVSRITVREAIGQLVNDGHLVRVRGKGTFVAHRAVQSKLHLASFTEEMRAQGHHPTTVVLVSEQGPVPENTAAALNMRPGSDGYHVKRLRLADGEPVSVDDGWFNPELLPGLLDMDLTGSIYRATADKYDKPIDRAEQTVSADGASTEIATLLGTRKGAPGSVLRSSVVQRDRTGRAHSQLVPIRPLPVADGSPGPSAAQNARRPIVIVRSERASTPSGVLALCVTPTSRTECRQWRRPHRRKGIRRCPVWNPSRLPGRSPSNRSCRCALDQS